MINIIKSAAIRRSPICQARFACNQLRYASNGSKPSSNLTYLNTLPTKDLISYFGIGVATLNKPILDTVIKLFPYVPMKLIEIFVSRIYCGGATAKETIDTGNKLAARHINNMMVSFTLEDAEGTKNLDINHIINETIRSVDDILIPHTENMIAQAVANGGTADQIPPGYVALKPSALVKDPAFVMKNYNVKEHQAKWQELVDNCCRIVEHVYKRNKELAAKYPTRTVPLVVAVMDAEKYELQQAVYVLQRSLFKKYNPKEAPGACMVGTIQMYLKQSQSVLNHEIELAEKEGYKIGLKLVRGAYIHTEPDRGVIHDTKSDTDRSYDDGVSVAAQNLLSGGVVGHLVVASHSRDSMMKATLLLGDNNRKYNITLAQLLGMADNITFDLIQNYGVTNIIKYVPWGPPLETKDYLLRRLEENGDAVRSDNGFPLIKGVVSALFKKVF